MRSEESLKNLAALGSLLAASTLENNESGVLSGLSGIAMFHFYYAKLINSQEHYDLGISKISSCVDNIGESFYMNTFCSGVAGVGWVLSHLEEEKFVNGINADIYKQIDTHLHTIMVREMKVGNYDFLHGGIGYAWYFLKRYNLTKDRRYLIILNEFTELLLACAVNDGKMSRWIQPKTNNLSDLTNLSLAHGMASIVTILASLAQINGIKKLALPLLQSAVAYLRYNKNRKTYAKVHYPTYTNHEDNTYNSRLAWCYGDLGVGLSLFKASHVLKNQKMEEQALSTLSNTLNRRTYLQTEINDAMICHGAFGLYNVYNHIYRITKNKSFKKCAFWWYYEAFKFTNTQEGIFPFGMWNVKENCWKNDLTILNGISGVGLSIISHLKGWDKWNKCLMIC